MTPTPSGGKERLTSIQALRALAAFLVLFGHAQTEAAQMADGNFTRIVFPWGAGVDIFFVISGFIMVYASRNLFGMRGGWREFLALRLWRIIPLYYIYTIAMIIAIITFPEQLNSSELSSSGTLKSFLFIPYQNDEGQFRPILGLGWTLNYEMFFYLIFAFCIPFALQRSVSIILIALTTIVVTGAFFQPDLPPLAFWTNPIILEFGAGAMLGYAYLAGRMGNSDGDTNTRLLAFCAVAALAFPLILEFYNPGFLSRTLGWGLMGVLLVYLAVWHIGAPRWPPLRRTLVALGDSSYSLYLSHPFALAIWKIIWPFKDQRVWDWPYVLSATVFATVCGLLSYYILERLILARLNPVRRSALRSS